MRLTPFLTFKEKWGQWLQVPSSEAIIGTRLAFRPPERITPFNASRLNRFIQTLGTVDWTEVNAFIDETAPKPDSRFIDKYREAIVKLGQTPESLAASYSVAIRVKPKKVRTGP
jgi:hypothetical protein